MEHADGDTAQSPPSDAPPPIHSFEVTGFTEEEAAKAARKHLHGGERLIDITLVKTGRSGLWSLGKHPSVFRATAAGEGEPAPFEADVVAAIQDSFDCSFAGAYLTCPLRGLPASAPGLDEAFRIALAFLEGHGLSAIDKKALKKALREPQERSIMIGSIDGSLSVKQSPHCCILLVQPPP